MNEELIKTLTMGEQDGRGVGGRGAHLSPQVHQEYISFCLGGSPPSLKRSFMVCLPGQTKSSLHAG